MYTHQYIPQGKTSIDVDHPAFLDIFPWAKPMLIGLP